MGRIGFVTASAALLMLVAGVSPGMAEPPYITMGWADVTLSQAECMQRAAKAVRSAGFTNDVAVINVTTYATAGDYRVGIRCDAELKELVVFVTSGPDYARTQEGNKKLRASFFE
jgi:hypothetical protein